jgi:hypothetical protein
LVILKGIAAPLVGLIVLNIVFVTIMVLGPLFYAIPFFCIAATPQDNLSRLAQLYFWLGPPSAAFWMLLSCPTCDPLDSDASSTLPALLLAGSPFVPVTLQQRQH